MSKRRKTSEVGSAAESSREIRHARREARERDKNEYFGINGLPLECTWIIVEDLPWTFPFKLQLTSFKWKRHFPLVITKLDSGEPRDGQRRVGMSITKNPALSEFVNTKKYLPGLKSVEVTLAPKDGQSNMRLLKAFFSAQMPLLRSLSLVLIGDPPALPQPFAPLAQQPLTAVSLDLDFTHLPSWLIEALPPSIVRFSLYNSSRFDSSDQEIADWLSQLVEKLPSIESLTLRFPESCGQEIFRPLRGLEKLQRLSVSDLLLREDSVGLAEESFPPSLDWNNITYNYVHSFVRLLGSARGVSDEKFLRVLRHTKSFRIDNYLPNSCPLDEYMGRLELMMKHFGISKLATTPGFLSFILVLTLNSATFDDEILTILLVKYAIPHLEQRVSAEFVARTFPELDLPELRLKVYTEAFSLQHQVFSILEKLVSAGAPLDIYCPLRPGHSLLTYISPSLLLQLLRSNLRPPRGYVARTAKAIAAACPADRFASLAAQSDEFAAANLLQLFELELSEIPRFYVPQEEVDLVWRRAMEQLPEKKEEYLAAIAALLTKKHWRNRPYLSHLNDIVLRKGACTT